MSVLEVIVMSKFVPGGLVLAALFPVSAFAAVSATPALPSSPTTPIRHSFFTSNEDRAEVSAHVAKMFQKLDTNRDGFIDKSELAALQAQFDERAAKNAPKRAARMFDRLDADHDGKITLAEAASRHTKARSAKSTRRGGSALFAHADANKDGVITRAEFDAATASGKVKLRHAAMRGSQIVRMFDTADLNHDGRLSLDEAQKGALAKFDAADLNRDGVLTPVERRQAAKASRAKRLTS
jgi:hypothetical protein